MISRFKQCLLTACLTFSLLGHGFNLKEIQDAAKLKRLNLAAEKSMQEGRFEEALAKLKEAGKLQTDDVDTLNNLGICYYKMQHYYKAMKYFKKVITLKSEDPTARKYLKKINRSDTTAYSKAYRGKIRTKHFVFDTPPENKKSYILMGKKLEAMYQRISSALAAKLYSPVMIKLFANEDDFFKTYGKKHKRYKRGSLLGVAQKSRRRILINSIVEKDRFVLVVGHELVHFLLHDKIPSRRLWGLEEGLANFLAGKKANRSYLKKRLHKNDRLGSYLFKRNATYENKHSYEISTALYYELSTALIEFVQFKGGEKRLAIFLNDLSMKQKVDPMDIFIGSLSFDSEKAFQAAFMEWIQAADPPPEDALSEKNH